MLGSNCPQKTKREQGRARFQQRLQRETELSKKAEADLTAMESKELELIQMLETVQQKQQEAYNHLEKALTKKDGPRMTQTRAKRKIRPSNRTPRRQK